jgi:hypothetical protein
VSALCDGVNGTLNSQGNSRTAAQKVNRDVVFSDKTD